MNFETENIEFKSKFTEEIYKEVIAFANTEGGIIYVGIDDKGNIVGIEDIDDEYTRVTNGIRDAITPDVTMFVHFKIQENKVLQIAISEGTNKPYYLRSKGLKPNGVYVRQGTSSAQATPELIRRMIKLSDGDKFEEERSLEQGITFNEAVKAFQKYGVEFTESKYVTLGIKQHNTGMYTNLGMLISDNCSYTIKVAVFNDDTKTSFKDRKEFGGSIFQQLEDTYNYLMLCNKNAAVFKGLERIDILDYPESVLREALLNALIHRDYSYSGSIIINITDAEVEIVSIGGLTDGLTLEDIKSGISQPRNKKLADIFYRLNLIEAYGTGIRRIFKQYQGCKNQPRIEITEHTFKIILPNQNGAVSKSGIKNQTLQNQKILEYVKEKGSITQAEICDLLNVKQTRAYTIAKSMIDSGVLKMEGRGQSKKYFV